MAYDATIPADAEFIANGPADIRQNQAAIVNDAIVNAGTVNGLSTGNLSGNIPVSNGTLNSNLNAEQLGGLFSTAFSLASHIHANATESSNGFMANTDKTKLDGIATGAQVNQDAFGNISVGSETLQSSVPNDTLNIAAGTNIVLTPDNTNKKFTIGVTGTVASATSAIKDGDGSVISSTYLPLIGGIMAGDISGDIRIKNAAGTLCHFTNAGYMGFTDITTGKNVLYYSKSLATLTSDLATLGFNVVSANKLSTQVTINGVSFDGSTSIIVADGTKLPLAGGVMSGDINGNISIKNLSNTLSFFLSDGYMGLTDLSTGKNVLYYNKSAGGITSDLATIGINVNSVGGYTAAALLAAAGGIVASSLGTNGYIKFSNGFILQWGTSTIGQNTVITLPISFPSVCASVSAIGYQFYNLSLVSKSITNIILNSTAQTINWIAIGY